MAKTILDVVCYYVIVRMVISFIGGFIGARRADKQGIPA